MSQPPAQPARFMLLRGAPGETCCSTAPWGLARWPHDGHLLAGCCSHDTHKRPKLLLLSHLHFCRILSHASVLVEVLSAVTSLPVQPSWTAWFKSLDQPAAQTHGCCGRFLLIRSASCRKVGSAVHSHPE